MGRGALDKAENLEGQGQCLGFLLCGCVCWIGVKCLLYRSGVAFVLWWLLKRWRVCW